MKDFNSILILVIFLLAGNNALSQTLVFTGEAESADESGTAVVVKTCASASGGEAVQLDANTNGGIYVQWNSVNVAEAGTYQLEFSYYQNADSKLKVWVNGTNTSTEDFPTSGGWCPTVTTNTINIDLLAGGNVLKLSSVWNQKAPFIDKVDVYSVPVVQVSDINVTGEGGATSVVVDGTLQMLAEVLPVDATDPSVTWSVTDGNGSGIIDAAGLFTAVTLGTVTVVATANDGSGVTGSYELTIMENVVPVTSISVTSQNNSDSVSISNTLQLFAEVLPTDASDNTVTWSVTEGTGNAVISETGLLYGVTEGTVTVYATASDASGISGSKEIRVVPEVDTNVYTKEAEDATLSGDSYEIKTGCDNASAGLFVKLLSDITNTISFDDIDIQEAGTYRLKIYYFDATAQPFKLTVNGQESIETVTPANWCYQGAPSEYNVLVELESGINTISLSPEGTTYTPLFDWISIEKHIPSAASFSITSIRAFINAPLEILVSLNNPVLTEQSFELEITGGIAGNYSLNPGVIIINEGENTASTVFTGTIAGTGAILIKNISSGLVFITDGPAIEVVDQSAKFYISADGDDANNGTSESTPWKTIQKVSNSSFIPGDSIFFRSGDTFDGQLVVTSSGEPDSPIVYSGYGPGDKPVIDGANCDGGSYETAILVENQQFIELRNLKITNDRNLSRPGSDDYVSHGIYIHNSGDEVMEYFRLIDLNIEEIYPVMLPDGDFNSISVGGVLVRSERNNEIGKEKYVKDLLMQGCYVTHTAKYGFAGQHAGGDTGVGDEMVNRNIDFVFRNNHFFETGGSGIIPSKTYNCLIENNIFEYTGHSDQSEPRLIGRGSGAWFWSCRNVVSQYNISLHVRGPKDSYGQHIDWGNEYILMQYNYSEDSEGGFVEILGDNKYSTYRFNISVNDGLRDNACNTLWLSTYSSSGTPSDENYIYNNSVYVGGNLTPDIKLSGANTYIYNNIFQTSDDAFIGNSCTLSEINGSFSVDNNIFFGSIKSKFTDLDQAALFANPRYNQPGSLDSGDGYKLEEGSPALNTAKSFVEPPFPQAGIGIFKDVTANATKDFFGNPVDLSTGAHIGAFNGAPLPLTKAIVNLILSKTGLSSGDSTEIIAQLDREPISEQTVNFEITGISNDLYTLSASEIVVPFDKKQGIVVMTANADNKNAADVPGTITLTTATEGLDLGTTLSSDIIILKSDYITALTDNLEKISVYPNPVTHYLKVELDESIVESIEILDNNGHVVKMSKSENGMLDVLGISPGLYIVRIVTTNKAVFLSKIIKE
ncbi:MAG: Ig-like domain-containing protein [Bacteroidota bacterium]